MLARLNKKRTIPSKIKGGKKTYSEKYHRSRKITYGILSKTKS